MYTKELHDFANYVDKKLGMCGIPPTGLGSDGRENKVGSGQTD